MSASSTFSKPSYAKISRNEHRLHAAIPAIRREIAAY
jgi:hypothetical protein